jgi:hypothetical protein
MARYLAAIVFGIVFGGCGTPEMDKSPEWTISVLPPSIRLDPSTNEIIDGRYISLKNKASIYKDVLKKNWIYDGQRVSLHGARGEYVSFQLILTNQRDTTLRDIRVEMPPFRNGNAMFANQPELFLEWAVEVKSKSTGYPKASLGKGWYPDALIPFKYIQQDSSKVRNNWVYPLWLPDFNNRIDNQKSLIIWVDQYIPFEKSEAGPGLYSTSVSVSIGGKVQEIPIDLKVWSFVVPNENKFKASLQHEGFLSKMNESEELELYQLFRRNRIALLDPTYKPQFSYTPNGNLTVNWKNFDERMGKYLNGRVFTSEYGYNYGPGYGEPLETFALPFDVYGKHRTIGWPNVGKPDVERNPRNSAIYIQAIKSVRDHFKNLINPKKTDITVYLNGLDESYFHEAWNRMVYYGNLFRTCYPEAHFRIDGGYSEEAMAIVKGSINSWASHTLNYDIKKVGKYQKMGIEDWIYGPLIYESKVNAWVGSSTFIDLPMVNDRGISWACWKYGSYSWISWGIGAGWEKGWYDPESWKNEYKSGADTDSSYTYKKLNGNALLVYSPGIVPNVNGPCPSIRLKSMRDGVQEYEYMRLLAGSDNNRERTDSIVNTIVNQPFGPGSIGNLQIWSFDVREWDQARIKLGELLEQTVNRNQNDQK